MPRTEEANQRIRYEQRIKLLQAAGKVFARKGRAATMADVAAEASVSYGLAYCYFPSKEVLFQTLIEQRLQTARSAWQGILERPGTPGERLDFLISRLVENRRESPELSLLFHQVLSDEATPAGIRELAARHGGAFQDTLRRLIVAGQETGEVAAGDPDQLVTAVVAYLEGLTSLVAWNPGQLKRHFPDASIILRILMPRKGGK
jgi:AcrR family transcriptional regulator